MDKSEIYRSVLVMVIQWLDRNRQSDSKIRRIVDLVLNHNFTAEHAIDYANREEEVAIQLGQK
tara:strand:+ start:347 stop:535 length:189 start_codon:yes stop_codon:yes gene_type:complete